VAFPNRELGMLQMGYPRPQYPWMELWAEYMGILPRGNHLDGYVIGFTICWCHQIINIEDFPYVVTNFRKGLEILLPLVRHEAPWVSVLVFHILMLFYFWNI
jgi:hypothetical protein